MVPALHLFCAVSFIGYGVSCLATDHMVREFERYGLARYRVLTGVLQILGAAGLLAGFQFPMVGALAAGGLSLQMLLGYWVRLKIGDRFLLGVPALAYMVVCAWLCVRFLR
ncbi:MAG: DoxX family protein [Verrucomicrobia bacterium]|nr:DoxX family protein [Verrucomicrobiota bacterium]MDA1005848.1 DoxX family protein [Verrucomicrobiota bacterium]